jgi:hypothetical protein
MTLYVTYIHRSHQIIKPSTMTTTSDIVQDVLNLLGSGDVSEETRVRLRTFLEHKRCYGNFDNLRLESSDSTYTYAIKGSTELQRDDTLARFVREGGCGLDVTSVMDNLHCHMKTSLAIFKYSDKAGRPISFATSYHIALFKAYFSHTYVGSKQKQWKSLFSYLFKTIFFVTNL